MVRALALLLLLVPVSSAAQDVPPPQGAADAGVEDLVARERVRAQFETLITEIESDADLDDPTSSIAWAVERLVALGPQAGPFVIAELERQSPSTFHIMALALSRLRPAGAEQALRTMASRAETTAGARLGGPMKAWAVYALAVLGAQDAIDLLLEGPAQAHRVDFMYEMTALEVAAVLTAPAGVQRLVQLLEAAKADPQRAAEVAAFADALGGPADRAATASLLPLVRHPSYPIRRVAFTSLATIADPASVDTMLEVLASSEDERDRQNAALVLAAIHPAGREKALLAHLEKEDHTGTRGTLYRLLASMGGDALVEAFASHWGRPDAIDRAAILDALGRIRSIKGLNLVRAGLRDQDLRVAIQALDSLAAIGGPGATDTLLASLRDGRDAVSQTAIEILTDRGEARAAPRIAEMMLAELRSGASLTSRRDRLRIMGDALVRLRYTAPADELRAVASELPDASLGAELLHTVERLQMLEAGGDDRGAWVALLESPSEGVRRVAIARLGQIGGPEGARALAAAFGRHPGPEDVEVLRAVGDTRAPREAMPLLERVLLGDVFDAPGLEPLRSMASWSARRLGGPEMADLLRRAAERRDGRDVQVLVSYALLAGRDAVPLLAGLRQRRFAYYDYDRGREVARLDWIVRELSGGRSIRSLDRSPEQIALGH